ncbi:hypothetical protein [Burkholderia sp. WSM2232]|uniref:hypothetical protein n=1 Tax=Burkholderia sp. WSM2232 TaxID=944436 RepID=UPI0004155600|nr:hypothetical protein [Burkholderia sp. WSM2232]
MEMRPVLLHSSYSFFPIVAGAASGVVDILTSAQAALLEKRFARSFDLNRLSMVFNF